MVVSMKSVKVSLLGRFQAVPEKKSGWTTQDVADLYRIADQLTQFGFPVSLQTGLSEENDPWAVFERDSTSDVVVHVARIDGELIIADVVRDRIYRGLNFRSLADKLLAEAPLTLPRAEDRSNVVLHPRMVMIAFVAAAFVLSDFTKPTVVKVGELEGDADAVPPEEAAQNLVDKYSGRDGPVGMGGAQVAALTAGLYALSLHLVQDIAKNNVEVSENTEQGQSNLFQKAVYTQDTQELQFDIPVALNAQELTDKSLVQGLSIESDADVTDVMRFGLDDDTNLVAPSVAVASMVQDVTMLKTVVAASKHAFYEKEFSQESVSDQPDADPSATSSSEPSATSSADPSADPSATSSSDPSADPSATSSSEPSTRDISAAEVLDLVVSSVTVMKIPVLRYDDIGEGDVVVKASKLAPSLVDVSEMPSNSFSPLLKTGSQLDTALNPNDHYVLINELSQSIYLTSDLTDVLVYDGGDIEVYGFEFGKDQIAFTESFTPRDWLETVSVVGRDVLLVGQGGSVTLFDALEDFV